MYLGMCDKSALGSSTCKRWPTACKEKIQLISDISSGPKEEYANYVFLLQLLTTSAETYMVVRHTRFLSLPLWEARYIS